MSNNSECGERRCTLEGAETEFRHYMSGYTAHLRKLTKEEIDGLHPSMTRVKTELDEIGELLEKAKKRGADAWDGVKDSVQRALDRLAANYDEAVHGTPK